MEQRIKIAIVEDELIIANHIKATLQSMEYEVATPASSYEKALIMLEKEQPDIVLLDITLNRSSKDGIELARYIRDHIGIPFIFLTAGSDTGTLARAKEVMPDAFLAKPFQKTDLYMAIEIAVRNQQANNPAPVDHADLKNPGRTTLIIKDGASIYKVLSEDIIFLSSEHVYVTIHTTTKKYIIRAKLVDYLDKLDSSKFLRVHRRFIVNTAKIDKIDSTFLQIMNNKIPVSKRHRGNLVAHFHKS
jgi:two-component system, LytTR family, response regulator